MHVNTQICIFCNASFSRMQSIPEKFMIHLTQLDTVSLSHVKWSTRILNSLHVNKYATSALLNPNQKYPSTLTWKHKASFQSLCINFRGELSTIAALMFAVLHVLLNSLCTVKSCLVISPKRMSIHRYASLCNAPFSRMQSILEKCMIHLTQLSTISSSHVRWSARVLNGLHVNPV